jgi:hypothetical protein
MCTGWVCAMIGESSPIHFFTWLNWYQFCCNKITFSYWWTFSREALRVHKLLPTSFRIIYESWLYLHSCNMCKTLGFLCLCVWKPDIYLLVSSWGDEFSLLHLCINTLSQWVYTFLFQAEGCDLWPSIWGEIFTYYIMRKYNCFLRYNMNNFEDVTMF